MDTFAKTAEIKEISHDEKDMCTIYLVTEDNREFKIFCTTRPFPQGRSIHLVGDEGLLYVDSRDNRVHRQLAVPGGGCGLRIDDEVVEGLSPLALRSVLSAYDKKSIPKETQ